MWLPQPYMGRSGCYGLLHAGSGGGRPWRRKNFISISRPYPRRCRRRVDWREWPAAACRGEAGQPNATGAELIKLCTAGKRTGRALRRRHKPALRPTPIIAPRVALFALKDWYREHGLWRMSAPRHCIDTWIRPTQSSCLGSDAAWWAFAEKFDDVYCQRKLH